ncbi:MAG: S24 family peptidase [bacterium]
MLRTKNDISVIAGFESLTKANSLFKVRGDSMINAGIESGDYLLVSSSIKPKDGEIAVIGFDGYLLVKRVYFYRNTIKLISENPKYKPLLINKINKINYLGKVLSSIKELPSIA